MPKATDKTFTEKLVSIWKGKSAKFDVPRFGEGFILHHYASQVEYKTAGWLDKNKDPLNDNITRLLANSTEKLVANMFFDYAGEEDESSIVRRVVSTVKKGAFRTVAQRHKEQLTSLMTQLHSTQPHFVRCIVPNEEKKARKIDANLVLDQLRCNGVLEGIRICRQGFPNRLPFSDFRQRYEILTPNVIPKGFMDGRKASQQMLESLGLDKNQYRLGTSKVFFRAGVVRSSPNCINRFSWPNWKSNAICVWVK
jgi:myosin protein heavy chain